MLYTESSDESWITNSNIEMIKKCFQQTKDPAILEFCKTHRKKLYKGGNKSLPNFTLDSNGVLLHIKRVGQREEMREVVTASRARELVKAMHNRSAGICNPGGINALEKSFCSTYYYRGIRAIVKTVLDQCDGSCKLSKCLETMPPVPRANRTMQVMEEVQCDLITITAKKGVPHCMEHNFKYILCVKDCFSKYCWLTPLESKEALPISRVLAKIFHDHGAPKFLHSDNGSEFVNAVVKDVCNRFDVRMKQGRPYHPQSQGQVENLNRRVKNCLRHFLLAYEECERSKAWPVLVKEIEYFINHTWHRTIQCTPYTAFHGRTGSVKMGDKCAEHEYMEEDFLSINDAEEDLYFDLNSVSLCDISVPLHHGDKQTLQMLGKVQLQHAELKKKIFEATESTILHNKRAHITRMKHRNYSMGQSVLFRNPNSDGLASTLNVRGKITEKIGIDLYQVQYGDRTIVLFGCQMVGENTVIDQHSPSAGNQLPLNRKKLTTDFVLEKIYEFADLQRKYIVAKRKYKTGAEGISVDDLTKKIGIEKSDMPAVYYSALDCAFLASIASDDNWRSNLYEYHETLHAYLQSNHFQYFLSGVYFWETFRAQTISLLLHCISNQAIPLFHYCSDCLDNEICSHLCCKLWLQNACNKVGPGMTSVSSGLPELSTSSSNNLLLLAAVASKQLEKCHTKSAGETRTPAYPRKYSKKLTLSKQHRTEKADKHHKDYIERNLASITMSRGLFTERMEELRKKILQSLHMWCNLTSVERNNLYSNVRYAVTIIHRQAPSYQVKNAGTLPFMQLQGNSNYCGLCALNNLLGKDILSVQRMNNVADDLWLRQIEQCGQCLTDSLQCHRDISGFYSFHTIEESLECFGHSLHLLSANEALRTMLRHKQSSVKSVLQELERQYGTPIKLLFVDRESEHYTAVHVGSNTIWHFDSKQRTPITLTMEAFVLKLQQQYETTYSLQPKQIEVLFESWII